MGGSLQEAIDQEPGFAEARKKDARVDDILNVALRLEGLARNCSVHAAGVAEVKYGAAKGHPGLVLMTTLGTGIGSALIYRGVLIPNTELGHLEIDGHDAESQAAKEGRRFLYDGILSSGHGDAACSSCHA